MHSLRVVPICLLALVAGPMFAQARGQAAPNNYHIYAGSTHAHTEYTWSHGEQWAKSKCKGILDYRWPGPDATTSGWSGTSVASDGCASIYVVSGLQYPGPKEVLKPDWKEVQGPPSRHFELAKQDGFDFYVSSDHSQESVFWPWGPDNTAWKATKEQAAAATGPSFVALAGFEYSENDGPGGKGHLNVINSDSILDALAPGINLPYFYKWLEHARPNGIGPVVASFNHPGPKQYDDFAYRDPLVTDIITMFEVINSNVHIHYEGFLEALDKGWKVSPVSGLDNHGLTGIGKFTSRTFLLATSKSKAALLDAMKHRRTYASLDENLQCRYTVNGSIMGSTLQRPSELRFDISLSDPDTGNAADKITRIDIVEDGGKVTQTHILSDPAYAVEWKPVIRDKIARYFFVRVWNAGGGDAPKGDPTKPVAWLAPVWTGR